MVLVSGLKDMKLKEKLSELETPTLPAFTVLVDAYMHSKATAGESSASANKVANSPYKQQKKNNNNNNNSGGARPGLSEAEKKRRVVMKGKCFRCGKADHFANNCQVPKDIKCHKCSAIGHTQAACIKGQSQARVTQKNHQVWPLSMTILPSMLKLHSRKLMHTRPRLSIWVIRITQSPPHLCYCD